MTPDTRESETPLVPYLRNVANAGRGSAMTEALHQAADTITAQAQEIAELRELLRVAQGFIPQTADAYQAIDRAIEGAKQ